MERDKETHTSCTTALKLEPRPRCRPKKRCTRRLHHPMRRFKKERLWNQQSPPPVLSENERESLQTQRVPPKGGCYSRKSESLHIDRAKPTSRPKRKCRFGPKARQTRASQGYRIQSLHPSHQHSKPQTKGLQETTHCHQGEVLSPQNGEFRTLTDKVTL